MLSKIKDAAIPFLMPILVFSVLFSAYSFIYLVSIGHTVLDDIFYHMAHAVSYLNGTSGSFDYPVYSTFSTMPVDSYYLYHKLMALFITGFNGINFEYLITRIKFMYCLMIGLYFAGIYLVSAAVARSIFNCSKKTGRILGLVTTSLLYSIAITFDLRLILLRPLIVPSFLVILSFLFIIRRWTWPMFLISFILPFFYSLTPVMLLVPIFYGFTVFVHSGFKSHFWNVAGPFLVMLSGLILGTLLHPNALNYVYNGSFVNLMVILGRFNGMTPEGGELNSATLMLNDFLWFLPYILCLAFYIYKFLKYKTLEKTISPNKLFLLLSTSFLFVLFMEINRTSEYLFPLLIMFIVFTFYDMILEGLDELKSPKVADDGNLIYSIRKFVCSLSDLLFSNRKYLKILFTILLIIFPLITTFSLTELSLKLITPDDKHKAAADFIHADSKAGDIVFTQVFHNYTQLVFYNNFDRYIMGTGSAYTYEYDKSLYFLWYHIVKGGNICPEIKCDGKKSLDAYSVIKDVFKAQYVFLELGNESKPWKLAERLSSDPRFKKVFQDKKYPDVVVYKI